MNRPHKQQIEASPRPQVPTPENWASDKKHYINYKGLHFDCPQAIPYTRALLPADLHPSYDSFHCGVCANLLASVFGSPRMVFHMLVEEQTIPALPLTPDAAPPLRVV